MRAVPHRGRDLGLSGGLSGGLTVFLRPDGLRDSWGGGGAEGTREDVDTSFEPPATWIQTLDRPTLASPPFLPLTLPSDSPPLPPPPRVLVSPDLT